MAISKTFKLVAWSYANQALSMALLLIQVKVLTHFLPINDYGAWSQMNIANQMVVMFLGLNLGHGFIRFASGFSSEKKEQCFFSILLFNTALLLLAALAFSPAASPITRFLSGSSSLGLYWMLAGLIVFSMSVDSVQRYFLVTGRELQMVQQNFLRLFLNVLFVIGFVFFIPSVKSAVLALGISNLACFLLFSWHGRIKFNKFYYSHAMIRELLAFSVPLMSVTIAYWVINSSNRYLVNYFMGLEAVGRFSVANRLPMMLVIIFTLLSTIFLSNVSRLFDAKNFERVSYWFSLIIKLFLYLGVAGGAALIAGNRALTLILSNETYLFDGLPMVYLFVVIGSLSFGCFQIISRLYELEKQVFRSSRNWIFAMLLNVGLNVWLIPRYGLVGGAIATGASFSSAFIIGWIFRPRRIVLSLPRFRLFFYAVISLSAAWFYAVRVDGVFVTGLWLPLLVAAGFAGMVMLFGFLLRIVSWREVMAVVVKQ